MKTERWWKNRQSSVSIQRESQKKYYSTLSDEALCLLYRQTREQEIILELLNRYDRYIVFLAMPFIHLLDSISDFKSDLFLLLTRVLLSSKPKVFKHWLGRIVKNTIYDKMKKKKPDLMEELPAKKCESAQQWNFKLDFITVLMAIERLKPDQRIYIELAFFGGYKQREIREILEWPKDKPRSVRQNALKNLKKILGGAGSDFLLYMETK